MFIFNGFSLSFAVSVCWWRCSGIPNSSNCWAPLQNVNSSLFEIFSFVDRRSFVFFWKTKFPFFIHSLLLPPRTCFALHCSYFRYSHSVGAAISLQRPERWLGIRKKKSLKCFTIFFPHFFFVSVCLLMQAKHVISLNDSRWSRTPRRNKRKKSSFYFYFTSNSNWFAFILYLFSSNFSSEFSFALPSESFDSILFS